MCGACESASAASGVISSPATTTGLHGGVMPALRAAPLPAARPRGTYSCDMESAVRYPNFFTPQARGCGGCAVPRSWQAGVMPEQKAEYVESLRRRGRRVAMAGDGVNDSAALARADLSIAMGSGSDVAMDVAQMTIVRSDLALVPEAIALSRRTVRVVRENLFWAFIYNVLAIPIAAGALYPLWGYQIDPMVAGAAMALSSVSVVTNSLRLKH